MTGGTGDFVLDAPSPGRYLLIAGSSGFHPSVMRVSARHETATANLRMIASPTLCGAVLEECLHDPVPEAVVVLLDHEGAVLDSAITGADGEFRFSGLDAGGYTLVAGRDGYEPRVLPVRVLAEHLTTTEVILATMLVEVTGTLAYRDGAPGGGIRLTITDRVGITVATRSDASGRYLFSGIPAGNYTLAIEGAPDTSRAIAALDDEEQVREDFILGLRSPRDNGRAGPPCS